MKKILAFLLVMIMLFSVVACNGTEDTGEDGSSTTAASTTEPVAEDPSLSIKGVDISEYKIVYSVNPKAEMYAKYPKLVTEDTEYDRQTAERLAAMIKERYGAELPIVKSTELKAGEKEINIGVNNRPIDRGSMQGMTTEKSYIVKVMENGNLFIEGASFGAKWHAVEGFMDRILEQESAKVDLTSEFKLMGEANMLIVGCVGDSLTYGSIPSSYRSEVDSADRQEIVPYPAVLQRMEWKNMQVYNYGHGGRTMIEDFMVAGEGDRSYIDSPQYTLVMNKMKELDLIIMMLGTNDGNPKRAADTNYTIGSTAFKEKFTASCEKMVNAMKAKNADIEIVMMNAPVIIGANWEKELSTYVRGYQKETAEKLGLTLYDMFSYTKTMDPRDFRDGVHPCDEGYASFAKGINELIKPTVEKLLK